MTASVLEQDPNIKGAKERYLFGQNTIYAHFQGNPLYRAIK